jgi:hypothetical protein
MYRIEARISIISKKRKMLRTSEAPSLTFCRNQPAAGDNPAVGETPGEAVTAGETVTTGDSVTTGWSVTLGRMSFVAEGYNVIVGPTVLPGVLFRVQPTAKSASRMTMIVTINTFFIQSASFTYSFSFSEAVYEEVKLAINYRPINSRNMLPRGTKLSSERLIK